MIKLMMFERQTIYQEYESMNLTRMKKYFEIITRIAKQVYFVSQKTPFYIKSKNNTPCE